jgi:hypothetical protein
MILLETEIQHALNQAQAAFPTLSKWAYHNAKDEDYFGFALWGCFQPAPEVLLKSRKEDKPG